MASPLDVYSAAFDRSRQKNIGSHQYLDRNGSNPFANKNDCFANLHALEYEIFGVLAGKIFCKELNNRAEALSSPSGFNKRFAQITDGILARIRRIVRQQSAEPDLKIIVDDDLFWQVVQIDKGDDPFGVIKFYNGFFLNRAVLKNPTNDKERELYKRVFKAVDAKVGFKADRIALVPREILLCAPWVVVHEVIHDVIDMSSKRKPETFALLVKKIFKLLQKEEPFTDTYGRNKRIDSFGGLFYDITNVSHEDIREEETRSKAEAVKEFAAKFFSGQLLDESTEDAHSLQNRFAYYFIQMKMPQDIRDLFFELGLRWPPAIKLPQDRRV